MANKYFRVRRDKGGKATYASKVTGLGELVTLSPHSSEAQTISSAVKTLIESRYAKRKAYGSISFEDVPASLVDEATIAADQSVVTGDAFERLQKEVQESRERLAQGAESFRLLQRDLAERDQMIKNQSADLKSAQARFEGAEQQIAELTTRLAEALQPPPSPEKSNNNTADPNKKK